jgi:uridine kinase
MRALHAGETVSLDAKSPASEEAGVEARLIQPRPIVVAAGFLALHEGRVNGLFDTTVFIDLPEDEMQARRRARANPANPWDTEAYIAEGLVTGTRRHVLPQREVAEHILDGTRPPQELTEEVLAIIREAESR